MLFITLLSFTVFVLTFDANNYRSTIQAKISELLGFEVFIEGDIALKLSLIPTVSAQDVKIKNPSWASRTHFAEIGLVELTFDLLSLGNNDPVITGLAVDNVNLLIEQSAQGLSNWPDQGIEVSRDEYSLSGYGRRTWDYLCR